MSLFGLGSEKEYKPAVFECPRHGAIVGVTFKFGDHHFCPKCIGEKLLELGVQEIKVKSDN